MYFGSDDPPITLICDGVTSPTCDPGTLHGNQTYYWQVEAKNCCGQTVGPVWSFTTECPLPAEPTNPDPPNGVSAVPVDTALMWNGGVARADVLLLTAGDGEPTILRSGLQAFPDINTVDWFNASMTAPVLADLAPYDVVVVMSVNVFYDPVQTGNALADYVDAGGKVVQAVATFHDGGGERWELDGRFVTQGSYEPFVHALEEFFPHSLGAFDADHRIMHGVTTLTDRYVVGVGLKPGAVWVADWDNGTPLVATRGDDVVGINVEASDTGDFGGDVPLLFHNAVAWLLGGGSSPTSYDMYFGTDNPPAMLIYQDVADPICDPGMLDTATEYYWQVVARNACGQTPGPLWRFTTECLDTLDCDDGNVCTYEECTDGVCSNTPRLYGDVDGNGTRNVFDIFCILDLIAGEPVEPECNAVNADTEPCVANGTLNVFDIFAVLNAIAGVDPCCSLPSPRVATAAPGREISRHRAGASNAVIRLTPSTRSIEPGDVVTVDVLISEVADLRGYEFALETVGGQEGRLSLESVTVDRGRPDYVFDGREAFDVGDVAGSRVVAAMAHGGVDARGEVYLATFAFQASKDAQGTFRIVVREEDGTMLLDSAGSPLSIQSVANTSVHLR